MPDLGRSLRRRRWWRGEGLSALRLLALEHWDPLGAYDVPERADEYDPFLRRLGRMLARDAGAEELARYLGEVRTRALRRSENEEADREFAARVVAWYRREAPR